MIQHFSNLCYNLIMYRDLKPAHTSLKNLFGSTKNFNEICLRQVFYLIIVDALKNSKIFVDQQVSVTWRDQRSKQIKCISSHFPSDCHLTKICFCYEAGCQYLKSLWGLTKIVRKTITVYTCITELMTEFFVK